MTGGACAVKDMRRWSSFALSCPPPTRTRFGCAPGCCGCRCVSRWLIASLLVISALATVFVVTAPPPLNQAELQRRCDHESDERAHACELT